MRFHFQTCDRYSDTGTNDTVQVKIRGESGTETEWKTLDYFWENDFEAGAVRDYTVTHEGTIGIPVILTFRKLKYIIYVKLIPPRQKNLFVKTVKILF